MTKRLKTVLQGFLAAGLIVLGVGVVQKAYAGNPDSMQISISASGTGYGVKISSVSASGAGYQFGAVPVTQTTQSTSAINVANTGTVGEFMVMTVGNVSGDNWTANTADGATAYDTYELLGHMVAHNAARPAFVPASDIISANQPSNGSGLYGNSVTVKPGVANSANSMDLWLQFAMPQSVATTGVQTFSLTITGQGT